MTTTNLGWHFYRKYYEGWNFGNKKPNNPVGKTADEAEKHFFETQNKILKSSDLPTDDLYDYKIDNSLNRSIKLTTTYPGLLLGSGYAHGIGAKGEFKIGFYFDHTTGLPVIPGSSVKGVLRSAFLRRPLSEEKEEQLPLAEGRLAYLKYLLVDKLKLNEALATEESLLAIEKEIFEGQYGTDGKNMPMPQRDVFHDAVIILKKGKPILGEDFITPHKNTSFEKDKIPHALKNPIPIQFLKVLPGVEFGFQFRLKEQYLAEDGTWVYRLLTVEKRLELFKLILLDLGIGAKTNVGYGQFENDLPRQVTHTPNVTNEANQKNDKNKPGDVTKKLEKWTKGEAGIISTVEKHEKQNVFFKPTNIEDFDGLLVVENVTLNQLKIFEIGKKFNLKLESKKPLKNGALPAKVHSFIPFPD